MARTPVDDFNGARLPRLPWVIRYLTAPAATLLALMLQKALLPQPDVGQFVFFFFGVALASALAGAASGLLTVVLSALAADYFFLAPDSRWSVGVHQLTVIGLFVLSASAVAFLFGALRSAVEDAQRRAARLGESQRRWQVLFEHAPIAIWEQDWSAVRARFDELRAAAVDDLEAHLREHPDELARLVRAVRTVDASRATRELFGLTGSAELPRDLGAFFDRESLPLMACEMAALWRGETSFVGEMPVKDANGRRRILDQRLLVAPGAEQTLARVIVSFSDLTPRLAAEHAVRENEARYRGLFESSREPILASDREGRITAANPAAVELLGYSLDELLRTTYWDLTPERWHGILSAELNQALERGFSNVYEKELMRRDGTTIPVSVRIWSSDGTGGRGTWAFVRDITEQKRMEQALRESNARKDEFLAILSHELRNPLAPIRNSLYILDRAVPGGEQAKRAKSVIDRQAAHMTHLIDELLNVTRIARGKVQLRKETVDLNDLVRGAVEDLRSVFEEHGVELEVRVADAPLWVHGDRDRLGQVLGNLLQNAAKFTQPGGRAAISVERTADDHALVRVRDTGIGIGRQTLSHLFEPFMQADQTLERGRGGLGLGLALVKGLVELHGGTVSAHSEGAGRGAEFVVRLPLAVAVAASPRDGVPRAGSDPRSRRVLVIEDNRDAADSLRELLELDGHVVEVSMSGAEGIQAAKRFRPDVVLCDIGLPTMDGYEVARAMRADPVLRDLFLVALTGYALPEDLKKAEEAGFDRHLAKPPTDEGLQRALADAGQASARRGAA